MADIAVNALYELVFYEYICLEDFSFVYKQCIFNYEKRHGNYAPAFLYFLEKLFHLSSITPKAASLIMPPLILDVPSMRSANVIGTSLILKPCFHAVNFISIWKA